MHGYCTEDQMKEDTLFLGTQMKVQLGDEGHCDLRRLIAESPLFRLDSLAVGETALR